MPTKRSVYFRWSDSRRPPVKDSRDVAARIIRAHRRSAIATVQYDRATRCIEVQTIGCDIRAIFTL